MLLEKIYQPDIAVYQEGVLGPMFMVEVVENQGLAQEAQERLTRFMASQVCFRGAIVVDGLMSILDIFPGIARSLRHDGNGQDRLVTRTETFCGVFQGSME